MVLKKRVLEILYFIFLFDTFFIPPKHIYGVIFKLSYYIAFFSLILSDFWAEFSFTPTSNILLALLLGYYFDLLRGEYNRSRGGENSENLSFSSCK